MKLFRILFLAIPFLFTACELSDQEKSDYAAVQRSGVGEATYDKMVHGDRLSVSDIEALSRAHVNEGIIIRYLRDNDSNYFLNSSDVAGLLRAGVSRSVIDYMLQSGRDYGVGYGYGPYGYGYGPYGYGYGDPFAFGPWFGPGFGPWFGGGFGYGFGHGGGGHGHHGR